MRPPKLPSFIKVNEPANRKMTICIKHICTHPLRYFIPINSHGKIDWGFVHEGGKRALCVCLCLRSCVYMLFAQVACCELSAEEHFYGACVCASVVFEGHFYVSTTPPPPPPPVPILTPIIFYGLSLEDFSVHLHLLISSTTPPPPSLFSLSLPPLSLSFYFTSFFSSLSTYMVWLWRCALSFIYKSPFVTLSVGYIIPGLLFFYIVAL